MNYLFQDGGKPKTKKSKTKTSTKSKTGTKSSTKTSSKTTKSKSSSKKGGNFLGAVGDLVAPSGWETFATTAGLFALDRADSALRRGKSEKSSAKKGGMSGGTPASNKLNEKLKEVEFAKKTREDFIKRFNKSDVKLSSNQKNTLTREISQFEGEISFLKDALKRNNETQKYILRTSFLVNTNNM